MLKFKLFSNNKDIQKELIKYKQFFRITYTNLITFLILVLRILYIRYLILSLI